MTGGAVCAAPPARFTTRSQKAATVARRAPTRPLSRDPRDARPGCRRRRRERGHGAIAGAARSRRSSRRRPRLSGMRWSSSSRSRRVRRRRAVPFGPCSMPRRTGFASPPSSLPRHRHVPSTTSPFRRSWRTRRRSGATRRRGSERSAELPRHGGDSLHDVVAVGRLHGQLMVHRRGHRPRAHGRGRLRRHAGGHVGAQRADDRGPAWRRQRASERPGVPPRTVRGRREQADAGHRPDRRLRSAHERPDRLSEHPSELARGQRVLDRHGDVCQRLVAGGLR